MQLYLSILCELKNRDFDITVNGMVWNGKMSNGSLKPKIIRASPNHYNIRYNILSIVSLETLNIHSINLRHNGNYINLTARKTYR
jgi:hypothetical protein